MPASIKHVFVLMLENRSFDHMLGYLPGVDGVKTGMSNPDPSASPLPPVQASNGATDRPASDPGHEFENVWQQLYSTPPPDGFTGDSSAVPTMQGFVASGGPETMACFTQAGVPVLTQLAQLFTVFDNWHSSMPGPTWPNRFFVHAGSSGGLTNSPSALTSLAGVTLDEAAFSFENGSIYDRLDDKGLSWRVFHGDALPQVLAVKRHVMPFIDNSANFASISPDSPDDAFATQLQSGQYEVAYTFIEPDYSILTNMYGGNSQHPKGNVSSGEALIKYVYETIRNSPVWVESLLLITYDEHGGFFDHVIPPTCDAPGDADLNLGHASDPYPFDFRRYGVRVPAVLVSPWVDAGVNHGLFDHTSVLKTLEEIFQLNALTDRDAGAASLLPLLTRPDPRVSDMQAPTKLNAPALQAMAAASVPIDPDAAPDPALAGFTRIAASLDIGLTHGQAPPAAPLVLEQIRLPETSVKTTKQSLDYIQSVLDRLNQHRASIARH
ncbi:MULTISPECIES: alkaline phosphatase family protein [unclassified Dyella]|uniref:alkaline phosphatase family protein n=1 Tax=unclassified Dyella TaxID=2634549 RepID=UPI000C82E9D7|nr:MULTISPECIES: alkaline phosphatase family protein [unclassified Dyella]MDR3444222.1 alkaline phosphatase family protein [Dyella sp.]PMQ06480.1 Non-hemolytic phospholipase C [Dyella sp. AD56]